MLCTFACACHDFLDNALVLSALAVMIVAETHARIALVATCVPLAVSMEAVQLSARPRSIRDMDLPTCMENHGLVDDREVCASKMLVHYKNRHGLMLSVHSVHANAATVHKVGHVKANSQIQCALSLLLKVITGRSTSPK